MAAVREHVGYKAEMPREPVGKVHKRIVVHVSGTDKGPTSVYRAFSEMLREYRPKIMASPNRDAAIDWFADRFVHSVTECSGWHFRVRAIAAYLERSGHDEFAKKLASAMRDHAGQAWSMRHEP